MSEVDISANENDNYKVDLSDEIRNLNKQTIVTLLNGLIVVSLILAVYFFFTQKPAGHTITLPGHQVTDNRTEKLSDEALPKTLQPGSRTLESELNNLEVNDSEVNDSKVETQQDHF